MRWLKDVQGRKNLKKKKKKWKLWANSKEEFAKNSDHNGTCNLKVTRLIHSRVYHRHNESIFIIRFDPSINNRIDTKSKENN